MTHDELLHKIEAGEYRLAFHGTARKISAFTEQRVGHGADRNSSLGLFLSEIPDSAADYAQSAFEAGEGNAARIYVVAIPCEKPHIENSYQRFFGVDDDEIPMCTGAHFASWRRQLLSDGHDLIEYEGVGDVINVCLAPHRAQIVACLDYEQALELQSDGLQLFDSASIFRHVIKKHGSVTILAQPNKITHADINHP